MCGFECVVGVWLEICLKEDVLSETGESLKKGVVGVNPI